MEARRPCRTKAEVQSLSVPAPVGINSDELRICLNILQQVADDPAIIDQHPRFKTLIAKIHRAGQRGVKHQRRQARQAEDRIRTEQTGIIRQQQSNSLPCLSVAANEYSKNAAEQGVSIDFPTACGSSTKSYELATDWGARATAPVDPPILIDARSCYVCKQKFTALHPFYHLLCPDCSALNWAKRQQRADLSDRSALVTGGRIKIGFQTVLKLLRDGARVLVTTRFPHDAAQRYCSEPDFETWRERLEIQGLDLRDLVQIEAFASRLLERGTPLDILIHNAAQTVKRPLAFYRHLLEGNSPPPRALPLLSDPDLKTVLLETRPQYRGHLPGPESLFPIEMFDRDGQQVDFRPVNSWLLKLGDVSTVEMLETWLVNAAAPFILTGRLKPLMLKSEFARRFVVNVSAMEGQFARENKTVYHPHTNMAKAALNMLTRTSATDLARHGIFMNSVDTGWITDEKPLPVAERMRNDHGFYTPLDMIDGAARIYDPIATGINEPGEPLFGHFLKDYGPFSW